MLLQEERFVVLFLKSSVINVQRGITALLHLRNTQRKKVGTEGYFRKETEGFSWDRRVISVP